MTDPSELFARLTCEVEDLHAIAIEGQVSDIPVDVSRILVGQFCNGLQRLHGLIALLDTALGGRST